MAEAKDRQISKPSLEVIPHKSEFLPGVDTMKLKQLMDELDMEDYLNESKG